MADILCMIPVRLGSNRVKYKNLRYFHEKPLVVHTVELAKTVFKAEDIWVNSDSSTIEQIAKQNKVQYHQRPEQLCSDQATSEDFVNEFLQHHNCKYLIMLNTTSPLITQNTMIKFIEYVQNNTFDTVLTVIQEKAEIYFKNNPLNFSPKKKINSQFLEPICKVVWGLTAWKRETFLDCVRNKVKNIHSQSPIFNGNVSTFVIPNNESIDIDTEEDWILAEALWDYKPKNKTYYK